MSAAGLPLWLSRSILPQFYNDESSKNLTQRDTYPFHAPMVLLPHASSVSSHGGHPAHYPMASMG